MTRVGADGNHRLARDDPRIGTAYLIHFDRPVGNARGYAWHYTGWAHDLGRRLEAHRGGWGSRLMEIVLDQGISWQLARTWPGVTREYERTLKRSGSARRYCPLCGVTPSRPRKVTLAGPAVVAAAPQLRHVLVRTAHPDWLDKFVQELGVAVVVGAPDYVQIGGGYIVRIFPGTQAGLITFGIVCDGYGEIIGEADETVLHRHPALSRILAGHPGPAAAGALPAAAALTRPRWARGLRSTAAAALSGQLLAVLSDAGGSPVSTSQIRQALRDRPGSLPEEAQRACGDAAGTATAPADPVGPGDVQRLLTRLARLGEIEKITVRGQHRLLWRRLATERNGQ